MIMTKSAIRSSIILFFTIITSCVDKGTDIENNIDLYPTDYLFYEIPKYEENTLSLSIVIPDEIRNKLEGEINLDLVEGDGVELINTVLTASEINNWDYERMIDLCNSSSYLSFSIKITPLIITNLRFEIICQDKIYHTDSYVLRIWDNKSDGRFSLHKGRLD